MWHKPRYTVAGFATGFSRFHAVPYQCYPPRKEIYITDKNKPKPKVNWIGTITVNRLQLTGRAFVHSARHLISCFLFRSIPRYPKSNFNIRATKRDTLRNLIIRYFEVYFSLVFDNTIRYYLKVSISRSILENIFLFLNFQFTVITKYVYTEQNRENKDQKLG